MSIETLQYEDGLIISPASIEVPDIIPDCLLGRPYDIHVGTTELYNRFGSLGVAALINDAPTNCQGLTAMYVEQTSGIILKPYMQSREINVSPDVDPNGPIQAVDITYFETIYGGLEQNQDKVRVGDIISLIRARTRHLGFPQIQFDAHLVAVCGFDELGRTRVLHADYRGVSVVRNIESLLKSPNYLNILSIRRPRNL